MARGVTTPAPSLRLGTILRVVTQESHKNRERLTLAAAAVSNHGDWRLQECISTASPPSPVTPPLPYLARPLCVLDGIARMAFPSGFNEAPRRKSTWPPTPEKILCPIESEQTCPVRSICHGPMSSTQYLLDQLCITRQGDRLIYSLPQHTS